MPNKKPAKPKRPLTAAIYHDENAAREHLEALLWKGAGATCPRCGQFGDRITKLAGKSTRPGVYKCKDCRKPFTVTVGTIFERSHIPLTKWLLAAALMQNGKKGMSAKELQRNIGTNYETAWFLFHRLRELPTKTDEAMPLGGYNRVIEADETYVGGKAKNKAFGPPPKKMAVFSLVERDGNVRSFHVTNVNADTLRPILTRHASRNSWLMTDESPIYPGIAKSYKGHGTVNHSDDEYSREGGFVTTNTVESFFALLKRGVFGNFHNISEAHLPRYLREFDWRYNHSHLSDAERADALISNAKGKRLMYHQPNKTRH